MPQVYLNWKRKSTVGWSLENVILDFTGGFFSFTQQFLDTVCRGKGFFAQTSGGFNIVKFLLSVIAMIFDIIFLVQHYVLYADKWKNVDKAAERLEKLEMIKGSFREMNEAGKGGRFLTSDEGLTTEDYNINLKRHNETSSDLGG